MEGVAGVGAVEATAGAEVEEAAEVEVLEEGEVVAAEAGPPLALATWSLLVGAAEVSAAAEETTVAEGAERGLEAEAAEAEEEVSATETKGKEQHQAQPQTWIL